MFRNVVTCPQVTTVCNVAAAGNIRLSNFPERLGTDLQFLHDTASRRCFALGRPLRARNACLESAVHILPGIAIAIGIIALCLAQPWLTIPVGIGCYALWRMG